MERVIFFLQQRSISNYSIHEILNPPTRCQQPSFLARERQVVILPGRLGAGLPKAAERLETTTNL